MIYVVLIIIAIVIIVAVVNRKSSSVGRDNTFECEEKQGFWERLSTPAEKVAGKEGEKTAKRKIQSVMNEDDWLFTNLTVYSKEMDDVIVNRYGVFVIEVKDWNGEVTGRADDYNWIQRKETYPGQVYDNPKPNPIKQVKGQVNVLHRYLKDNGIRAWVSGKVWMLQGNSPVRDEMVLEKKWQVEQYIHTVGSPKGYYIDGETIEKIKELLMDSADF